MSHRPLRRIYLKAIYCTDNILLYIYIYIIVYICIYIYTLISRAHNLIQNFSKSQHKFSEFFRRRNLNMDALLCWALWVSTSKVGWPVTEKNASLGVHPTFNGLN